MGTYRPLYNIRIEHEYFNGNICRAVQCRLSSAGQMLCRRRSLLFRQTGTNEWTILYDDAGAGVDTLSDVLALELIMTDPDFVLYTRWNGFQPSSAYLLELPSGQETPEATDAIVEQSDKRQIGTGFCTVRLHLTEGMFSAAKAGTPETVRLQFRVPEYRWEYLFVPRSGEHIPPEKLRLEEYSGKLTFGPFNTVTEYDREMLSTISLDKIPLREQYAYRLRLISVAGEGGHRPGQVLLHQVTPPKPGVFLSKDPEFLRQLCYF